MWSSWTIRSRNNWKSTHFKKESYCDTKEPERHAVWTLCMLIGLSLRGFLVALVEDISGLPLNPPPVSLYIVYQPERMLSVSVRSSVLSLSPICQSDSLILGEEMKNIITGLQSCLSSSVTILWCLSGFTFSFPFRAKFPRNALHDSIIFRWTTRCYFADWKEKGKLGMSRKNKRTTTECASKTSNLMRIRSLWDKDPNRNSLKQMEVLPHNHD